MSISQKLIRNMKYLYDQKYITLRDGNISFKPRNKNYFYITAGSVLKNNMTPEQIIKVYFDEKNTWYDSHYKPSRELNIHYYIQRQKQYYLQDNFVVHTHPPNAVAYMGLNVHNIELNTIQQYFPEMNVGNIGKNVPFLDAGTDDLAKSCENHLYSPYTMVGMKQHGTLCVGSNIDEIIEHIETLEFYLNIYFRSSSINIRHLS